MSAWLTILKSYIKKIKFFFDQWWLKLLCLCLNAQPEIRILIGLYLSCIFRLLFKLKFLSQNLHENASPVWTFSWACLYNLFVKLFLQYWQEKGSSNVFSSVDTAKKILQNFTLNFHTRKLADISNGNQKFCYQGKC